MSSLEESTRTTKVVEQGGGSSEVGSPTLPLFSSLLSSPLLTYPFSSSLLPVLWSRRFGFSLLSTTSYYLLLLTFV